MIDKGAYIGMSGAKNSMHKLEILTNNLANVNTTGFRGDYEVMKPVKVSEDGLQTRVYSTMDSTYTNFKKGPILNTNRDLDLAVSGDGFFAIQSKTGQEGYTRAGSFDINSDGTLVTKNGEMVMGVTGVITIPPAEKMNIAKDGTVSVKLIGSNDILTVGRIKLANPAVDNLQKGTDGLFYTKDGSSAAADPTVKVITGAVEGSNVDPITTLTQLIDLSRHYEIHTNVLKNLSDNASVANRLFELPR